MSTSSRLMILFFLMLMNTFFSVSEIALSSARNLKLQLLADDGNEDAKLVLKLQDKPGDFFAAVQIGANAIAILSGIIGDDILKEPILNILTYFNPNYAIKFSFLGNIISFLVITFIFVEFADFIPKKLGIIYPETISIKIVSSMNMVIKIFKPIIRLIDGISVAIFKIFGIKNEKIDMITQDDIVALVDAGAEAGIVRKKEHSLIENIFELETRWVTSIMTTRDDITYISMNDSEEEISATIINNPHTKFLVVGENLDEILGYINSKDILPALLNEKQSSLKAIRDRYNKNLLVIPNTLTLSETLDKFNEAKDDFAIILNEYSHVTGLVTLNDVITTLMENVVYEKEEDLQIIKRDENSWLIDGITPLEDVKKALDSIEEFPEESSYETIAGFMMYMLKMIPKKGAKVEYENFIFEVVDVDSFKVDQLLVIRKNKNLI